MCYEASCWFRFTVNAPTNSSLRWRSRRSSDTKSVRSIMLSRRTRSPTNWQLTTLRSLPSPIGGATKMRRGMRFRSEERRVGKECRSRLGEDGEQKKVELKLGE